MKHKVQRITGCQWDPSPRFLRICLICMLVNLYIVEAWLAGIPWIMNLSTRSFIHHGFANPKLPSRSFS